MTLGYRVTSMASVKGRKKMYTLADQFNILTPERAGRELITRLSKYEPFFFRKSVTRSSMYIHFRNLPNKLEHKLRVSDHDERERYGYKWQLRLDGLDHITHWKQNRRYFANVDDLVKSFEYYYARVESLNAELLAHAAKFERGNNITL
jgi:hypothetical protein